MTLFHYKEQHDIIFSVDEERLELSSPGLTGRRSAIELLIHVGQDGLEQNFAGAASTRSGLRRTCFVAVFLVRNFRPSVTFVPFALLGYLVRIRHMLSPLSY